MSNLMTALKASKTKTERRSILLDEVLRPSKTQKVMLPSGFELDLRATLDLMTTKRFPIAWQKQNLPMTKEGVDPQLLCRARQVHIELQRLRGHGSFSIMGDMMGTLIDETLGQDVFELEAIARFFLYAFRYNSERYGMRPVAHPCAWYEWDAFLRK